MALIIINQLILPSHSQLGICLVLQKVHGAWNSEIRGNAHAKKIIPGLQLFLRQSKCLFESHLHRFLHVYLIPLFVGTFEFHPVFS